MSGFIFFLSVTNVNLCEERALYCNLCETNVPCTKEGEITRHRERNETCLGMEHNG